MLIDLKINICHETKLKIRLGLQVQYILQEI